MYVAKSPKIQKPSSFYPFRRTTPVLSTQLTPSILHRPRFIHFSHTHSSIFQWESGRMRHPGLAQPISLHTHNKMYRGNSLFTPTPHARVGSPDRTTIHPPYLGTIDELATCEHNKLTPVLWCRRQCAFWGWVGGLRVLCEICYGVGF